MPYLMEPVAEVPKPNLSASGRPLNPETQKAVETLQAQPGQVYKLLEAPRDPTKKSFMPAEITRTVSALRHRKMKVSVRTQDDIVTLYAWAPNTNGQ